MSAEKPEAGKSLEVASMLEAQILRTGLRAGWRLPSEEQLCRMHCVSRTVVREAMQRLKARGLVESRRGGGSFVAEIDENVVGRAMAAFSSLTGSSEGFGAALDLLAVVEGACARELTRRRDAASLARVKARLDATRRARDDARTFPGADAALHAAMAEESGNALFASVAGGIRAAMTPFATTLAESPEWRLRASADHDACFEAVRTGNAVAAESLARAHAAHERAAILAARVEFRG